MKRFYKGADILVTGGCGSVGSEIVRQLLEFKPKRIRVFDQNESGLFHLQEKLSSYKNVRYLIGNMRDKERLSRAVRGADIVFHAAALKHVPLCEYNPYEAVQSNVIGTQNLIVVCRDEGVKKMIAISTDKAVNPINTMGATKLLSEKLILTGGSGICKTLFSCVRFGNVLNSDGSVIPIFKRQISKGGPVTVTSENMTRFFMSMSQAVNLVLKAGKITKGGEIFILKMDSLRIIDLAKVMIEELAPRYGYDPKDIKIKIIGVRPGEKIYESLMTEEEISYAQELGDMFVLKIPIILPHLKSKKPISKLNYKEYNSKDVRLLAKEEIKNLLYRKKILM